MCIGGKLQSAIAFRDNHTEEPFFLQILPAFGCQVMQLLGNLPVTDHAAERLGRPIKEGLFLLAECRCREAKHVMPVGAAAEQLGLPPHRTGLQCLALGIRHAWHDLAVQGQQRAGHQ